MGETPREGDARWKELCVEGKDEAKISLAPGRLDPGGQGHDDSSLPTPPDIPAPARRACVREDVCVETTAPITHDET